MQTVKRDHWGSRTAFVLAAAGSAIGLGNIWKFPYITGQNGGGAFVLIYLGCIFMIGIPIVIAELYIGQKGQKNAIESFEVVHKKGTPWKITGWMGLVSAFLILSFYSVIGGWILDFVYRTVTGEFVNADEETIKGTLGRLFSAPIRQTFWHFIFMSLSVGIVVGGVKKGLERWNKILMPALLILLGGLFVHSMFSPGFGQAIDFLFSFNTDKLSSAGVLEAVGHAFFTLSLGMGTILTYGSYLKKDENLLKVAVTVALLDTVIALVAGVVIFSIVFSFGLEAGAGPGLIFSTLPVLFAKLPGGYYIAIAFFTLVAFAAMTSGVSILEVVVAYAGESHGISRKKATISSGIVIFFVGMLTVFSTNIMADVKPFFDLTFFDLFDKLTSSYLLPLGGVLMALFYGWVLGPKAVEETLPTLPKYMQIGFLWTVRVIAPALILWIIINKAIG